MLFADQRWHYAFTARFFSPVLEMIASPRPPSYPEVLKLDSQIREFDVPTYMQINPGTTSGNALCIVQLWTHMTREVGALTFQRLYVTQLP